jgi:hypothetical protein
VITKKIAAVFSGGEWSVVADISGEKKDYTGTSLKRILELVEYDTEFGLDGPDLHDLTGDTRHIGMRIPANWRRNQ